MCRVPLAWPGTFGVDAPPINAAVRFWRVTPMELGRATRQTMLFRDNLINSWKTAFT